MEDKYIEECLSIKPRYSVIYRRFHGYTRRGALPNSNRRFNDISVKSQRRLMSCIDWLVSLSIDKRVECQATKKAFKFKMSFITLTLPAQQIHPDEVIRQKCFEPLLRKLRRKCEMKYYVWKAETQKNGNIHFHITTNVFVHYKQLRIWWNSILFKLGYIQRSKYVEPPTTEVKAVRKSKDIAAYLAKYVSKTENDRTKPLCKLWDCNSELKSMKYTLREINNSPDNYTLTESHISVGFFKKLDHCILYKFNERLEKRKDDVSKAMQLILKELINDSGQYTHYYPKQLFKLKEEVNCYTE